MIKRKKNPLRYSNLRPIGYKMFHNFSRENFIKNPKLPIFENGSHTLLFFFFWFFFKEIQWVSSNLSNRSSLVVNPHFSEFFPIYFFMTGMSSFEIANDGFLTHFPPFPSFIFRPNAATPTCDEADLMQTSQYP